MSNLEGRERPDWVPILMYHRITLSEPERDPDRLCVSVERLAGQLDRLGEAGFAAVPLELATRSAGLGEGRRYVITFDDGYRDNLELALPALLARSVPAILFVPTHHLSRTSAWDADALPLLSPAELREWQAAGMLVGSHSRTHRRLTKLSDADLRDEVRGSKADLEDLLGEEVRYFAYPYHDMDARVADEVAEAGYAGAVGGRAGAHVRFNLHRVDAWRLQGWRFGAATGGLLHQVRRLPVPGPARRLAGRLI